NTQRMYQALMPNSIAVVIDDVKYSKSGLINDLDFGVYRVVGEKSQRIEYTIKNAVEFGLNSYVLSDSEYVPTSSRQGVRTKYYVPTMNSAKIETLKENLKTQHESLDPVDVQSLNLWIELAESIENDAVKEVPVDAKTLMSALDASIAEINYELKEMKAQAYNRQAQSTLFFIIIGILIELFAFFSFS
ncbi:MAG: hypothetical protein ACW99A_16670, partial [Candidatus Kariarchaeaceae archaeon]